MKTLAWQETFVLIKPDVIERALVGRILQKFEDADLKIEAIKDICVTSHLSENHYPYSKNWIHSLGGRVLKEFARQHLDPQKLLGTKDRNVLGKQIWEWSKDYIARSDVIACIISGPHAVDKVKQIVGDTNPLEAPRGTIRGDFCSDSIIHSNLEHRAIFNLVHRSANVEDAKREINLWFK